MKNKIENLIKEVGINEVESILQELKSKSKVNVKENLKKDFMVKYFNVTCIRLNKDLKFQNTEFNSVLNYNSLIKEFKSKDKGFDFQNIYLVDDIHKMNILNTQTFQIENDKHYWFYYVCRVR